MGAILFAWPPAQQVFAVAAGNNDLQPAHHASAGLAVQQCQQQAQQAAGNLARLEWLSEDGLLAEGVQPSQLGSWAAGPGIGVQLLEDTTAVS